MTVSANAFTPNGIVTLLTDFGDSDGYAGSIKGVILSQCPGLQILDISHNIPPFNILSAAYILDTYCRDYPAGAVHLAVVDPGVGSKRRAVAVHYGEHFFIAPDNGVLSMAVGQGGLYRAWEIHTVRPPRDQVSATFHGRDIFAPAAAHIACGGSPDDLGPEAGSIFVLDESVPTVSPRRISGQVIHVDRFGNLITNIRGILIKDRHPGTLLVKVGNYTVVGMSRTYADRESGELVVYTGSSGLVEIAIVQGNAASSVKTPVGRNVEIVFREKT